MKKYLILIAIIAVAGVSTTAFSTHVPTLFHNADVKVTDHNFVVQDDLGWAAITVQSNGFPSVIKLFDIDNNQNYFLKLEADGRALSIRDQTNGRDNLYIKTSNGFIGINNNSPVEQLDVNGDLHLSDGSAKITANGDICIGSGC